MDFSHGNSNKAYDILSENGTQNIYVWVYVYVSIYIYQCLCRLSNFNIEK